MLKETTQQRIEESIIRSFELDNEIVNFYDPSAVDIKKEEIPADIVRKLQGYDKIPSMKLKYFDFILDDKFCGYVAINEERKLLVSFGLRVRDSKTKDSFFSHIRKLLGGEFSCMLHQVNQRAVKWLVKSGMVIEKDNFEFDGHPYTILRYKSKFLI